jgi:hypothetical protein
LLSFSSAASTPARAALTTAASEPALELAWSETRKSSCATMASRCAARMRRVAASASAARSARSASLTSLA